MIEHLDRATISSCKERGPWTLGNEILYKMCADNFTHDKDEKIIAKVWLIGRSYAAAIERRKNKDPNEDSDKFYTETVTHAIISSDLDQRLCELSSYEVIDAEVLKYTIETHYYLTDLLRKITDLNKRSFSAKYLHFHLPNLFFIYDSRAAIGISSFNQKVPKYMLPYSSQYDKVYADFANKCFHLIQQINDRFDIHLTPRQIDNLLLKRI